MNGNFGHGPADVVYFALPGAVDPLGGTDYASLATRGNNLLARLDSLID